MALVFPQPRYMPCPLCGESVRVGWHDFHICDPERNLEYEVDQQMLELQDKISDFDCELTDWLNSPEGLFVQWLARQS